MNVKTNVDYSYIGDDNEQHVIPKGTEMHVDYFDYNSELYVAHSVKSGELGLLTYYEVIPTTS